MSAAQVRAALVAGAEKNKISGLTYGGNNIFLSVSNIGTNVPTPGPVPVPVPSQAPVPVPVPTQAPMPVPVPTLCPAGASSLYPDSAGDCRCPIGSYCYAMQYGQYYLGCAYSRPGFRDTTYFSSSCTSC